MVDGAGGKVEGSNLDTEGDALKQVRRMHGGGKDRWINM